MKAVPLDPTGHLLHQAMLPRKRVIAAVPNLLYLQKEIQGGCQNEETKKHGPNERTDQTPEKELNKMEISNLFIAEFKTLVTRMLKELSEDFGSIKKDSVRNKGYTN